MQPKEYQLKCIDAVRQFSLTLAEKHATWLNIEDSEIRSQVDYASLTWRTLDRLTAYVPKKTGTGEPLPNFCMKVPTGGGKTFLACHAIDQINQHFLKRKTGLVLWIVPTNQIYRQTLATLKDRAHPYRQVLDLSSGNRTQILEKASNFTPEDVQEKLCVMLLMLPSANRKAKETLKIFQDAGGYERFFPLEDDFKRQAELYALVPNLDIYGMPGKHLGLQIKTSLGNTLRTLRPLVILDEGQKAYSEGAQSTINGFNPRIIVELSATPPPGANKLVEITGQELNREQMIKLDIHLVNKQSTKWQDTLMHSVRKQQELEAAARDHVANAGIYIRPICLIQVERTGRDQRGAGYIHAEDAKEYLLKECGIDPSNVAIKSSDKDDIEGLNLYARDCEIRYIITKQALQEGWDCSFAYILAILTNPGSANSLTQLVGRILRQPNARKTGVKALDECYVFCFRQNASGLMKSIKTGLEGEGLGDLTGRVAVSAEDDEMDARPDVGYRAPFKKFEGKLYLPHFIIQENGRWRELKYEMDLVRRIDWTNVDLKPVTDLRLQERQAQDEYTSVRLSTSPALVIEKERETSMPIGPAGIDLLFITRHLLGVVANPWRAHSISSRVIAKLTKKHKPELVSANLVYIVEKLVEHLQAYRDGQAEKIFRQLIRDRKVCFFLQKGTGYEIPRSVRVNLGTPLFNTHTGEPVQKNLFDKVDKEELNEFEQSVAICLDEQTNLLFWYRNLVHAGYYIQGWQKNRIYPDFISTKRDPADPSSFNKVIVLETKGLHLKNDDTKYKQTIFEICTQFGEQVPWGELEVEFGDKQFTFQMVFENEFRQKVLEEFQ
jgi:type III restriction enzyme